MTDESVTIKSNQDWVTSQGQWLSGYPNEMNVLRFLTENSFRFPNNPENGEVGQVYYARSWYDEIMYGTGIRTKTTVAKIINSLVEKGYLLKSERPWKPENQPLLLKVRRFDEAYRESLRAKIQRMKEAENRIPEDVPELENVIQFRRGV